MISVISIFCCYHKDSTILLLFMTIELIVILIIKINKKLKKDLNERWTLLIV